MPNIKPGFKTTEFWLSLVPPVVTVVGTVAAADGYPINVPKAIAFVGGVVGTALSAHGYSGARALVKKELVNTQSYLEENLLYPTPPTPPKPPVAPPVEGPSSNLTIALGQLTDGV